MKNIKTKKLTKKLENYLEELKVIKNLSPKTVESNLLGNKLFIQYLKKLNIENISDKNIDEILKQYIIYRKSTKNNTYSTINNYLKSIISFFKRCFNMDIKVELPNDHSKNKKVKYLTIEEIKEVMENIPPRFFRDKAVIQTLYRTGLRVSELSNLKKTHIDLKSEDKTIAINVINGKGGKDRTVYIDQDTLKLINKMIYKRTRKNRKDKNEYLFTANTGNQLSTTSIQILVKKYAKLTDARLAATGVKTNYSERLTPHSLRHSYAIHLLNDENKPINVVQQLLGHSSIATTQIYTNVDNKVLKNSYGGVTW
jgi:site-specific recombinase XerD